MKTNCNDCSRYTSIGRCEAFPDGIPLEVLAGEVSHDLPISGDRGLLFASLFEAEIPVAYTEGRNDAQCRVGKPCKGESGKIVCIPKNSTCQSSKAKKLTASRLNRGLMIGAGATVLAGGAIALSVKASASGKEEDKEKVRRRYDRIRRG